MVQYSRVEWKKGEEIVQYRGGEEARGDTVQWSGISKRRWYSSGRTHLISKRALSPFLSISFLLQKLALLR